MTQTPMTCGGCGECCRRFPLAQSPDDIRRMIEAAELFTDLDFPDFTWTAEDETDYTHPLTPGLLLWMKALVPLESKESLEGLRLDPDDLWWKEDTFYRCTLLDDDARCTIHDIRPEVCRRFAPRSLGGYLSDHVSILYPECSYLDPDLWPTPDTTITQEDCDTLLDSLLDERDTSREEAR